MPRFHFLNLSAEVPVLLGGLYCIYAGRVKKKRSLFHCGLILVAVNALLIISEMIWPRL